MRKGIGVICIIFGVLLMVKGHDVGNSFLSRLKQALGGMPLDAALKLDFAGIGMGLLGLLLIFWKKR